MRSTTCLLFCGCVLLFSGRCATDKPVESVPTGKKTVVEESPESGLPEILYTTFGEISIGGAVYDHDVVFEDGQVRKRDKDPSKPLRDKYNHTPLTQLEDIPWDCKTLVIGTGMHGRLPIVEEFYEEAESRNVDLVILDTTEAVRYYLENVGSDVNAIFHVTC